MPVSRPAVGGAVLAILMGLGLSSTSEATPQVYSFEGLAAGTVVAGQLPDGQVLPHDVYSAFDISVQANKVPNSLAIFDTAHPTGNDPDLGTPNRDFGGPGVGEGGRRGTPGENRVAQGKVLIIPQNLTDINRDGLIDQPNDNADGGVIDIKFPKKGLFHSMTFIDIEEFGSSIDLYDGNQLVQSFPILALGDNSQGTVNIRTTSLVDRAVVTFASSGALAQMTFDPVGCLPPKCDVSGDLAACVGSLRTYTTTVGSEFTRQWSVSGPCSIEVNNGSSVSVRFTGAGACTVSLAASDPIDPKACTSTCSQVVQVSPLPPCGINGPEIACSGSSQSFTTDVGSAYTKEWSVTSTPPNICSVVPANAALNGSGIQLAFSGAGTCTLQLTVIDPADPENCRTVCTKIITVTDLPPCNIAGDVSVCVGNEKTYTTQVQSPLIRQWSVTSVPANICEVVVPTAPAGGPADQGSSVSLRFTGAGVCTLTLTVTDPNDPDNCFSTCSEIITVSPQPPCNISGDRTACVDNVKTYSTTVTGHTLKWSATSTPGGICAIEGSDSGSSVNVKFTGAGTCTLTLTVRNPADPEDCVTVCSIPVTVAPQPDCTFTGPASLCIGAQGNYQANAGAGHTYQWSATSTPAGICAIEGSTTGSGVKVNFSGAGSCTLSLTVRNANDPESCVSTCTRIITITETPACDIAGDLAVCVGNTKTYTTPIGDNFIRQWSVTSVPANICEVVVPTAPAGGPADQGSSVSLRFTGAGVCTLTLTVTDPNDPDNCFSTCSEIITVSPQPPCNISGDRTACVDNVKTYSTTVTGHTLKWSATSTPGGICAIEGSDSGSSVNVKFTGAGTCTLTLTVRNPADPEDCVTVCSIPVTVAPQPDCTFTGPASLCIGAQGNYQANAGAGHTYQWSATSTPAGICAIEGSTTGSGVKVNFSGAGSCTLSLTVRNANDPESCVSTCTRIITITETPACGITGDFTVCVGNTRTYATPVGNGFIRQWSATSVPNDICNFVTPVVAITGNGPVDQGPSVQVRFNGAGVCTLTLTVTDPNDPECVSTCSEIITISPQPPCNISGPETRCIGESGTYSVNANGYAKSWSVTSTPAGIASIPGSKTGATAEVQFTGAGTCTISVTVTDPADPEHCRSTCTRIVQVSECTDPEPESCWMTGGGCLNYGGQGGHKNHTFGGNVGPQPSGSWQHIVRKGNKIEFNFHSWDATSDSCWKDAGPGPCSPAAENNNINYSGTGLYSIENGPRDQPARFRAHVEDRGESGHGPGSCGGKDYYEIWVYDLQGNQVFHAAGELDCGNLQIHKNARGKDDTVKGPTPSGSPAEGSPVLLAPASPNPFRMETRIAYTVSGDAGRDVTVGIYDVSGRLIRRISEGYAGPGDHETMWDGRTDGGDSVPGGIYFIRVSSGSAQSIGRVMLVR